MLDTLIAVLSAATGMTGIIIGMKQYLSSRKARQISKRLDTMRQNLALSELSKDELKSMLDPINLLIENDPTLTTIKTTYDSPKVQDPTSELNEEIISALYELINKIEQTNLRQSSKTIKGTKESGFLNVESLLLIIPGIIALLFAGTFIHLIIKNQSIPNYSAPKELTAAMTTILGYYFGIGASSSINAKRSITARNKP